MFFIGVTLLVVVGTFCCLRSSKEFPKNWKHLRFEVAFQYFGICALIEDFRMSKYNRSGKLSKGLVGDGADGGRVVEMVCYQSINCFGF